VPPDLQLLLKHLEVLSSSRLHPAFDFQLVLLLLLLQQRLFLLQFGTLLVLALDLQAVH